MARWRDRASQLLPIVAEQSDDEETADPIGNAEVAYRTRLRRPQGRARARSLRRPEVSRLEPSCICCALLLRVHHCRTCAAFFPLGRKAAGNQRAVARGL